jgi:hypothetical protein
VDKNESPQRVLHIACPAKSKGTYVHISKQKGLKLSAWIVETLDAEVERLNKATQ